MLLIEHEGGIKLHVRSVGKYLKRWGFTPQKPIRRAYEKSPVAVQKWLDETYSEIKQRAQQEEAEIHWGDETAVVKTDVCGRGAGSGGVSAGKVRPPQEEGCSGPTRRSRED